MATKKVVIRKYENRRLYDATNSRYVNLDEVAQMVRDGVDVQVVDATSGEDLTRVILTQIIVENAKAPDSAFPLDMLRQMIMASGRASQESALKYFRTMLDVYQNAARAFPAVAPFDFLQNMVPRSAAPPANGRDVEPAPPPSAPPDRELDNLKQRIAELENIVRDRGSAAQKPGKQAKRTRKT